MRLASAIAVLVALLAACAGTPPAPVTPSPSPSPSQPVEATAAATAPGTAPSAASPSLPGSTTAPSGAASLLPLGTLAPDAVFGVRMSGAFGTEYTALITILLEDGSVQRDDASGVIVGDEPVTQGLGDGIVAVRVEGSVRSAHGELLVEITGGHREGNVYVPDTVLARAQAAGGEDFRVDVGNVDS